MQKGKSTSFMASDSGCDCLTHYERNKVAHLGAMQFSKGALTVTFTVCGTAGWTLLLFETLSPTQWEEGSYYETCQGNGKISYWLSFFWSIAYHPVFGHYRQKVFHSTNTQQNSGREFKESNKKFPEDSTLRLAGMRTCRCIGKHLKD